MPQLLLHLSLPVFRKSYLDLDFEQESKDIQNVETIMTTSLIVCIMILDMESMNSSLFQVLRTMEEFLIPRGVDLKLLLTPSWS